jgi:hypothetical protein
MTFARGKASARELGASRPEKHVGCALLTQWCRLTLY